MEGEYILGIDVGTTSVKVCVITKDGNVTIAEKSELTRADVTRDSKSNEQDVVKIVAALQECMRYLHEDILKKVIGIGVCGQVHGIVFWNSEDKPWKTVSIDNRTGYRIDSGKVSYLYTWQDGRCDSAFLSTLPKSNSHLKAYTGYGCNTLFWLSRYQPEKIQKYNRASTIADFVVTMLCNLDMPLMSTQNAASWGYFNTKTCKWNVEILDKAGFPVRFLPPVTQPETIAGKVKRDWCGVPSGIPVGVALGDMQCSVFATLEKPEDAFINVSTSAQLAYVLDHFDPDESETFPLEYVVPYFDRKYLAVAALLNGGNALMTLVHSLQRWFNDVGVIIPADKLWNKLLELGKAARNDNALEITPIFLGERYCPDERASIRNITPENFNLGQIFKATCHGIINNIHSILPRKLLIDAGINRIVGSGSALVKNPCLQKEVQEMYNLPIVFRTARDSPHGAAVFVSTILME